MAVKNKLVPVEEEVWDRMKEQAARERRPLWEVVGNALRLYLAPVGVSERPAMNRQPGQEVAEFPQQHEQHLAQRAGHPSADDLRRQLESAGLPVTRVRYDPPEETF